MRVWVRLIAALMMLATAARVSRACSCMAAGPVCSIQMGKSVVFRGTLVELTLFPNVWTAKGKDGTPQQLRGNGRYRARFVVAETFNGTAEQEQVVYTNEQGSACGFPFVQGKEYLVFADAHEDGELWTSRCSRTALLTTDVQNDALVWLRTRAQLPAGSEIFGSVLLPRDSARKTVPAVVHLSGPESRVVPTDGDGKFLAGHLQPGTYSATVTVPDGFGMGAAARTLTVEDRGCAVADWQVTYDGTIAGRVLDAEGKPVADLPMELVRAEAAGGRAIGQGGVVTELDGSYRFQHVSPGRYFVVAKDAGALTDEYTMAVFYPHADRAGAMPVTLGESAAVRGINFTLGKLKPTMPARVNVVGPDGEARAGLMVFAFPNGTRGHDPTRSGKTDESGTAILPLQQNREYGISVAQDRSHPGCGFVTKTFTEASTTATVTIATPGNCPK